MDLESHAIINVSEYPSELLDILGDAPEGATRIAELNRVNVPAKWRGRGIGRSLMKEVTDEADSLGVTLVLDINPYGALDFEALSAWYQRVGFTQRSDGRWWRSPQA
jgi:GNAT superfamily N-acetyltransferase